LLSAVSEIVPARKLCSCIDMQTNATCHGLYTHSSHLITLWSCPLTFWRQGQCLKRARDYVFTDFGLMV